MAIETHYYKYQDEYDCNVSEILMSSKYDMFRFKVRFNKHDEISEILSMTKIYSPESDFENIYLSTDNEITFEEYNEFLLKTLQFITKRNYAILVSNQ